MADFQGKNAQLLVVFQPKNTSFLVKFQGKFFLVHNNLLSEPSRMVVPKEAIAGLDAMIGKPVGIHFKRMGGGKCRHSAKLHKESRVADHG
jgi:hypothetical protein